MRNYSKTIFFITYIGISLFFVSGFYSIASFLSSGKDATAGVSAQEHSGMIKNLSEFRFHCDKDTLEIEAMLIELSSLKSHPLNEIIIAAAKLLEGRPYIANTLEGDEEKMVINVDGLDCVTFVENCVALAKTTSSGSHSWRDHARNLEIIRYRNGKQQGYDSRLHYTTDWIADNMKRGNLQEVTNSMPGYRIITKNLNFMTSHRDLYPALADERTYKNCKENERQFQAIQIPYISRYDSNNPEIAEILQDGDMISFVSNLDGLDSTHVALIRLIEGRPYMIHASLKKGKVVFETSPLHSYFKKYNRSSPGFRIVRFI